MGKPSSFLIISVLLVAPSASLAGPVPGPAPEPSAGAAPEPHHQAVVLPWGQGVAVGGGQATPGGFIYCAGCSPINPQQLVWPANVPLNKALPVISASGVLPPSHIPTEKQLNGLGTEQEPGKGQKIWDDGAMPVQQMALHDDGRYSFSYNTADASRQEERNLDGSVSGSYSYTDPDGKLVQIDYTAGPKGYNAYGQNVPPTPVFQLPQPVRETPEVQAAREKFLQAYAHELAKHRMASDTAHVSSTTVAPTPSDVASESTSPSGGDKDGEGEATTMTPAESNDEGDVLPLSAQNDEGNDAVHEDDAIVVSGKSEPGQDDEIKEHAVVGGGETVDDQSDSIVISADQPQGHNSPNPVNLNMPNPSYQITIPFGVGQNAGLSVQSNPQSTQKSGEAQPMPMQEQTNQLNGNINSNNLQPYFYYVSVGGSPHYITAPSIPGYNSPYPTSLQASLLGANPLAAVHDAQIPNRGTNDNNMNMMNMNMNSQTLPQASLRPVFLDLENSLKEGQAQQVQVPQNLNNGQWMQMQMNNMQMPQQTQAQSPSLFNNNQLNVQNNPLLGQLVPIQLAPLGYPNSGGYTFGYIPGLILNNNQNMVTPVNSQFQQQQHNQGSQPSNVQVSVPALTFNWPQQQQLQQPQQQQQQEQVQQQEDASPPTPALDEPEEASIVLASK